MTSHTKTGFDTYNGVQAPRYNVMSYTWGHYEDPSKGHPSLPIHGVSWPIPCIKREHFTNDMFLDAIRRVARGAYKEKCDWVWIDVACIPQEWAGETSEDIALRGQEIGRQVEIFQKADEVFAWLNGIQKSDIVKDQQDPALGRSNRSGYIGWREIASATQEVVDKGRWHVLDYLEAITLAYERYMKRILDHPWFQSLWTLQEMVLRSNGSRSKDGYILLDGHRGDTQHEWLSQVTIHKRRRRSPLRKGVWEEHISLHTLTTESDAIERYVLPKLRGKLRPLAGSCHPHDIASTPQDGQPDLKRICRRLEDLITLQNRRGLIAASVTVPHIVYSLASLRRVTHLVDRIYGIVQVYGISCNPNPKGNDELAKLHALEDEFGMQLVQKAPVLSQLFLHSSADDTPRRSWLITQKCDPKLMGSIGREFKADDGIKEHFEVFRVLPGPRGFDAGDLLLKFRGKAWSLGAFMEASSVRGGKETTSSMLDPTSYLVSKGEARSTPYSYLKDQYGLKLDATSYLFSADETLSDHCTHKEDQFGLKLNTASYFVVPGYPCDIKDRLMTDNYGLKLDYHISKSIFGHVVGNFPAEAEIHDAIYRVFRYYNRPYTSGVKRLGTIVVALLGSRWLGRVPSTEYAGLVLVCRDSSENIEECHANGKSSLPASREIHSTSTWERIGLIVWHETYYSPDYTPHELLPPPYVFQCSIV